MPTVRAPLTVVLAALAMALLALAPASAGGPTSALLSVPGEGKTASLYYTDAAYDDLAELVGVDGGTGRTDDSGQAHESGPGVTVTWLIHDVTPWRVDRIYLGAEGGPWIATQVATGDAASIWDSPVVWHRPTAGKELSSLLDRLGVGRVARASGDFDGVAGAPVPTTEAAAEPAAAEPAPADDGAGGVWWGVGGLAAGVLLALGWTRARSTRVEEPVPADDGQDWLAPAPRT